MNDLGAVLWKEIREQLQPGKQRNRFLLGLGMFTLLSGVAIPFLVRNYAMSIGAVAFFGIFSIFVGFMTLPADSFAGEKERHTLATLNASRLSNGSIVYGKMVGVVVMCLGSTLAAQLLALTIVCLMFGRWTGFLPGLFALLGVAGLALLVAPLIVGIGTIVSMKTSSVQQATQISSLVLLPVFMVPGFLLPFAAAQGVKVAPGRLPDEVVVLTIFASVLGAILVLDALLLWLAPWLYRRQRANLN